MQATIAGCWVVSTAWVTACSQQQRLVAEEEFEVDGDSKVIGGPRAGRLRRDLNTPLVFAGRKFIIREPLENMQLSEMRNLLTFGGGIISSNPDADTKERSAIIICSRAALKLGQSSVSASGGKVPAVSSYSGTLLDQTWVLDSISGYIARPFDNYVVSKGK
jgi:hypothetical protein